MFDVYVIGSGSSGNCILVDTGDCKFLLDAGMSFKDIKNGLKQKKLRLSDIDYILFTHFHIDHYKGIKNIVDKYNTPVITSYGEGMMLDISDANKIIVKNKKTIDYANTKVTAYDSIHDTNEPLYFSIENSIGEKLLYLTDCGTSDGIVLYEHDFVIMEANYYNEGILKSLKDDVIKVFQFSRTTSGTGHLELNQTITLLKDCVGKNTKHIILSHLSSTNANGELFKQKVTKALSFNDIDVAISGLNVVIGENPNIF